MGSEEKRRSFVDAAWDKFNGDMSADDCIGIYVPKLNARPAKMYRYHGTCLSRYV